MKYTARLEFEKRRYQIKSNRFLDRLNDRLESIVRHDLDGLQSAFRDWAAPRFATETARGIARAKFPAFLY